MAAKIGLLGDSTTATVGTTTVYTVPADKAARIRILFTFIGQGASTRDMAILIGTSGNITNMVQRITADNDLMFSGVTASSGIAKPSDIAIIQKNLSMNLNTVTGDLDTDRYPLPADFYLSTGDTVRYIITTNALSLAYFQVHGVEDDA